MRGKVKMTREELPEGQERKKAPMETKRMEENIFVLDADVADGKS
jgi:hypothetical protein